MGTTMQLSDRIGRQMKLHDLHVLIAVVQAGSMSKAAALLNTTQPAISRSIAELERTIGVRLLDRKPLGVEPTEYGRALLDGGAAVFDDLRQAVKNIEFLADPAAGEVRVGSPAPIAASFVSAVVDRLSRHYPRMVFQVVATDEDILRRELSGRNIDLLIARKVGPLICSTTSAGIARQYQSRNIASGGAFMEPHWSTFLVGVREERNS
jgi:DNA-binding transcriptional LysR family regulator